MNGTADNPMSEAANSPMNETAKIPMNETANKNERHCQKQMNETATNRINEMSFVVQIASRMRNHGILNLQATLMHNKCE